MLSAIFLAPVTNSFQTNGSSIWRDRTQHLLQRIEEVHFPNTTAWEICEPKALCNADQKSFKAYLARWMTLTSQLATFTFKQVHRLLGNSAKMAADTCIGGPRGTSCGMVWWKNGTFDETGVGQQMSALETTLSVLISFDDPDPVGSNSGQPKSGIAPPKTNLTGGTSASNPDAGHNPNAPKDGEIADPVLMKDRIGAWFLTVVLAITAALVYVFLSTTLLEHGISKPTIMGMAKGRTKDQNMEKRKTMRESMRVSNVLSPTMKTLEEEPNPKYRETNIIT